MELLLFSPLSYNISHTQSHTREFGMLGIMTGLVFLSHSKGWENELSAVRGWEWTVGRVHAALSFMKEQEEKIRDSKQGQVDGY